MPRCGSAAPRAPSRATSSVPTTTGERASSSTRPTDPLGPPSTSSSRSSARTAALVIYWSGRWQRSRRRVAVQRGRRALARRASTGRTTVLRVRERAAALQRPDDRSARRSTSAAIDLGRRRRLLRGVGRGLDRPPRARGARYPDPERVYFGHATDPRGLTRAHAIDPGDLPTEWLGRRRQGLADRPSPRRHGRARPRPGDLPRRPPSCCSSPAITGDVPTRSRPLEPAGDGSWYGPAAFDGYAEVEPDAETP